MPRGYALQSISAAGVRLRAHVNLKFPVAGLPESAPQHLPLSKTTALGLERALLSADRAQRQQELATAAAQDPQFTSWALRTAEYRLSRTVNRIDEAVDWLAGRLEIELLASFQVDAAEQLAGDVNDIAWRFPRLVARLGSCETRLAQFDERLESEKLESLKELAYGASHEINNPLANIAARAQTLLADEPDPDRQRKLAAIHRQAMRAHEMISDLMLFARPPKLQRQNCDLSALVNSTIGRLQELAHENNTEVRLEPPSENLHLQLDPTQIGVAVQALIVNSLEAAGPGGHVHIVLQQKDVEGRPWATISVRDDGPGISEAVREHLFDPFYSGREAGRGLGFGLSKCWRIVTDHGGRVIVYQPTTGAEVAILLPIAHASTVQ
jgi:signal transduction histidine kinase